MPGALTAALPEGLLVAGAALAAALGARPAARWATLLAPALALVALTLGPAVGASVRGDGAQRALEVALLAGALAAAVIGHERRRRGGEGDPLPALLLGAAGLLVLGRAATLAPAVGGFALATAPIAWSLRGAHDLAGRHGGASLVAGGLLAVGLALVVATSATGRLDLVALPVAEGEALAGASRRLALGVVIAGLGLTHLLAAPPVATAWTTALGSAPSSTLVWLAVCAPSAAAALGLRLLGGLRLPSGGLVLADLDPGAVLGAAGALAIVAARLATRRETDLGRLLLGQAAASGGWVLLGLGALGAPAAVEAPLVGRAVALLAASALLGHVSLAALVACADRELGGRGLERWVGAARRNRALATALVLATATLAGAPPTLGFVARLHVLVAALEGGYAPLALIGALDVAAGLALTLRVARVALLARGPRPAHGPDAVEPLVTTPGLTVLAVVLAGLGAALGLFPGGLLTAMG